MTYTVSKKTIKNTYNNDISTDLVCTSVVSVATAMMT